MVQWGGVRYPGQHRALISDGLFDRVQQTLHSRDVAGMRQRRHDHYLKGLLHCGECGRRLSLTLAKGSYLYFYCLGQRGTARTGCRQPYVLSGDADPILLDPQELERDRVRVEGLQQLASFFGEPGERLRQDDSPL